ncbi:MAG TPA: hypothetical protein VK666_26165, partial [Chryseolinea sp.]|nr:hypothetical protein [Chryseolinea sp.]
MIYPESFEEKLGFDQIRQKLKGYCLSTAGEDWVDQMTFSPQVDVVKRLLKQNLEFRQVLEKGEAFPSRYFFDAGEWLRKIGVEGNWLEADDFLSLAYSIDTIV